MPKAALKQYMDRKLKVITPVDVDLAVNAISKLSLACIITNDLRGPKASKIVKVNDAFAKMFGYNRNDLIGKSAKIFQGKETDIEGLRQFRSELDSIGHSSITVVNYRQDGTPFEVMLVASHVDALLKINNTPECAFVCFAYYVSDAKLCLSKTNPRTLN